ncbi:MAG: ABC transporter ATP-binding protein, partial [Bacillota bacterium]|nr:ABC transporter ATP-binding protein [Bacillota bacterium]
VFQDPMTSLNPVLTVGQQIGEALALHLGLRGRAARERMVELLRLVGIPSPEVRLNQYPHQLSGGMRQRVMIALALSCQPRLLIADEPTTALDVTIQAQIIELLKELKQRLGMAIILITHDLGVVAGLCSRLLVMYAGRLAEAGSTRALYRNPCHPYTKGLLQSVPRLDAEEKRRLVPIPGQPPDLLAPPPGCRFHPRCPQAMAVCQRLEPPELEVEPGHTVTCWLYHPLAAAALAALRKEQTV